MVSITQLYGGALSVVLPIQSFDVSTVREVPDNQEVFTHSSTDQSIIFDILEYVPEPDEQAIHSHFQELVDSNGASDCKIKHIEEIDGSEVSMSQCDKAYYILAQQNVSKYNETVKNIVDTHLGLFRLKSFSTDILVTFNDPVNIHPESSSHKPMSTSTIRWTDLDFKQVLTSLKILDTGLFVV